MMNIKTFTQQMKQSEEPLFQALHALQQTPLVRVKSHQDFSAWQQWVPGQCGQSPSRYLS
ncbi:MAG TPA: hypothetical protein DCE41_04325 [Cytophagales bacterium]|nr:hypothetical protein [Cytophagales bacterium]HAA21338.1 hypothetical protein [Cytophagales bacterium]HAP60031.1 hypothetical protein [Cytophagales bacterium]